MIQFKDPKKRFHLIDSKALIKRLKSDINLHNDNLKKSPINTFEYKLNTKLLKSFVELIGWTKNNSTNDLPLGFPTHTKDIKGNIICLGDTVGYDFDDSTSSFRVIFEENAFRKEYKEWDQTLGKPLLESNNMAKELRLIIIAKA